MKWSCCREAYTQDGRWPSHGKSNPLPCCTDEIVNMGVESNLCLNVRISQNRLKLTFELGTLPMSESPDWTGSTETFGTNNLHPNVVCREIFCKDGWLTVRI